MKKMILLAIGLLGVGTLLAEAQYGTESPITGFFGILLGEDFDYKISHSKINDENGREYIRATPDYQKHISRIYQLKPSYCEVRLNDKGKVYSIKAVYDRKTRNRNSIIADLQEKYGAFDTTQKEIVIINRANLSRSLKILQGDDVIVYYYDTKTYNESNRNVY